MFFLLLQKEGLRDDVLPTARSFEPPREHQDQTRSTVLILSTLSTAFNPELLNIDFNDRVIDFPF